MSVKQRPCHDAQLTFLNIRPGPAAAAQPKLASRKQSWQTCKAWTHTRRTKDWWPHSPPMQREQAQHTTLQLMACSCWPSHRLFTFASFPDQEASSAEPFGTINHRAAQLTSKRHLRLHRPCCFGPAASPTVTQEGQKEKWHHARVTLPTCACASSSGNQFKK